MTKLILVSIDNLQQMGRIIYSQACLRLICTDAFEKGINPPILSFPKECYNIIEGKRQKAELNFLHQEVGNQPGKIRPITLMSYFHEGLSPVVVRQKGHGGYIYIYIYIYMSSSAGIWKWMAFCVRVAIRWKLRIFFPLGKNPYCGSQDSWIDSFTQSPLNKLEAGTP